MITRRRIGQLPEEGSGPAAAWTDSTPSNRSGGDRNNRPSGSIVSDGSNKQSLFGASSLSCFPQQLTFRCGQDRTKEFVAVIKSMQIRQNIQPSTSSEKTGRNEFSTIASKIGKDLASTLAKLEKLSLLSAKRSQNSTDSQATEQLTGIVRQDLRVLNKQISQLQQVLKSARIPVSRHAQIHANAVTVALQSKLVAISAEFKAVLEQNTKELKSESFPENRPLPPKHSSYNEFQAETSSDYTGSQFVINMDEGNQARHRQQQLTRHKVEQRSEDMTSVEQTIVELGGIFQQFAHMVKEQEEMIQRIDTHIEDAHLNIDVAHSEIVKYFHTISSNRSLMLKIFVVLIVFFTLFVYMIR